MTQQTQLSGWAIRKLLDMTSYMGEVTVFMLIRTFSCTHRTASEQQSDRGDY